MSLDLEEGDLEAADADPAERRRRARAAARQEAAKEKNAAKPSSQTRRTKASERVETELLSRLMRVFDRIAKTLEARGDEELAHIVREDADAMCQGLASLTHSVKFLRSPLLMALNLVEPVLAFGRIIRVLYGRWLERQARIAAERQEMESSPAPTQ